jgi:hypothetical protein
MFAVHILRASSHLDGPPEVGWACLSRTRSTYWGGAYPQPSGNKCFPLKDNGEKINWPNSRLMGHLPVFRPLAENTDRLE